MHESLMTMPVMHVRVMRVLMRHRIVTMQVHVRFGSIPLEIVLVQVMSIVRMRMAVRERFVTMFVRVPLGQMQRYARRHQAGR